LHPVAIELDLMDPALATRIFSNRGRQLRFDESGVGSFDAFCGQLGAWMGRESSCASEPGLKPGANGSFRGAPGTIVTCQEFFNALTSGCAMVKETKFFRKQADKAERMARATSDAEVSQSLLNITRAYRSQADVLKAKQKSGKKRRRSP
jgi:hypothetical protein